MNKTQAAVTITLTPHNCTDEFKNRMFTLTPHEPVMKIGRSSRSRHPDRAAPLWANASFTSPVVSRNHAQLAMDGDRKILTIKDLGSMHGTLINGISLYKDVPHPLKQKDRITLGNTIVQGPTSYSAREFSIEWLWHAYSSPPTSVGSESKEKATTDSHGIALPSQPLISHLASNSVFTVPETDSENDSNYESSDLDDAENEEDDFSSGSECEVNPSENHSTSGAESVIELNQECAKSRPMPGSTAASPIDVDVQPEASIVDLISEDENCSPTHSSGSNVNGASHLRVWTNHRKPNCLETNQGTTSGIKHVTIESVASAEDHDEDDAFEEDDTEIHKIAPVNVTDACHLDPNFPDSRQDIRSCSTANTTFINAENLGVCESETFDHANTLSANRSAEEMASDESLKIAKITCDPMPEKVSESFQPSTHIGAKETFLGVNKVSCKTPYDGTASVVPQKAGEYSLQKDYDSSDSRHQSSTSLNSEHDTNNTPGYPLNRAAMHDFNAPEPNSIPPCAFKPLPLAWQYPGTRGTYVNPYRPSKIGSALSSTPRNRCAMTSDFSSNKMWNEPRESRSEKGPFRVMPYLDPEWAKVRPHRFCLPPLVPNNPPLVSNHTSPSYGLPPTNPEMIPITLEPEVDARRLHHTWSPKSLSVPSSSTPTGLAANPQIFSPQEGLENPCEVRDTHLKGTQITCNAKKRKFGDTSQQVAESETSTVLSNNPAPENILTGTEPNLAHTTIPVPAPSANASLGKTRSRSISNDNGAGQPNLMAQSKIKFSVSKPVRAVNQVLTGHVSKRDASTTAEGLEEPPAKKTRLWSASPFWAGAVVGGLGVMGVLIALPDSLF